MTTLVTGAGGFLGGHVVRELGRRGEDVVALDLAFPGPLPEGVRRIEGSVLDPDTVAQAMDGVAHVVHAAAIAHLWTPGRFDYDRVNVVGTCRVLAEARRAGARVVHVSSYTALIGRETTPGELLDETREVPPSHMLGRYPRSKRQAELAVLSAVEAGVDAVIVMPSAPLGAEDHRLTPPMALLRDLARGKVPALLDCTLNLVDAVAVANTIVEARVRGRSGQRYLLSGRDIAIGEFAGMVAERTGVKAPRTRVPLFVALAAARVEAVISRVTKKPPKAPLTGVRLAARACGFSAAKAEDELGFAPRPLEACLDEALDWLREAGHLD